MSTNQIEQRADARSAMQRASAWARLLTPSVR